MTISKEWIEQLELAHPFEWVEYSQHTKNPHLNLFPVHDEKPRQEGPQITGPLNTRKRANDTQHGGTHYKQFKGCEPWDVITAWKLGYLDGTALKYIARWRDKGGVEDLKKAIHFLQKTIEVEEAKANGVPGTIG